MQAHLRTAVFCLAACFYLGAGTYKASHFSADFIPVYTGARCLVHGCNPYNGEQLGQQYLAAHGIEKVMPPGYWVERPPVYPPSTFVALSPLALLRFRIAAVLWAMLGGTALIVATWLAISAAAKADSWVPTLLGSFILVLGDGLLGTGNPATFACSLAVIGAMLFLSGRFIPLGAVLLTLSLAVKPQVAGLIILYFLARGIGRRWAALSLGGGLAFLLLGMLILQMHPGSRDWMPSLRANIAECVLPGHVNDPSPVSRHSGLTNLQTLTSVFLASPKAWNAAALGITAVFFVLWIISIKRLELGVPNHFLALPPLLVLSLFPMYHRSCDALLLLLSFPMIVTVMRRHRVLGTIIALVTALPFLSDAITFRLVSIVGRFWNLADALSHKAVFIVLMRPWSLELLVLFVLYLIALQALSSRSAAAARVHSAVPHDLTLAAHR